MLTPDILEPTVHLPGPSKRASGKATAKAPAKRSTATAKEVKQGSSRKRVETERAVAADDDDDDDVADDELAMEEEMEEASGSGGLLMSCWLLALLIWPRFTQCPPPCPHCAPGNTAHAVVVKTG